MLYELDDNASRAPILTTDALYADGDDWCRLTEALVVAIEGVFNADVEERQTLTRPPGTLS